VELGRVSDLLATPLLNRVTTNARHFPVKILRPQGIEPISPDRFVRLLCQQEPDAVFRASEQHRTSLRQPLAPADYLDSLRKYAEVPESADRLASMGFSTRPRPLDQSAGATSG